MSQTSGHISAVTLGVLRALSLCAPDALANTAAAVQTASTALTADIPAQSLSQALDAFGRQTGLQLIYVSRIADAQQSRGARAGLSASAALAELLEGSGLRFEFLNARTIRIYAAPAAGPPTPRSGEPSRSITEKPAAHPLAIDEIVVTANRREEDVQDVPITIQVLTGDALARLNATTFDDFVRYLPGVTAHGSGPAQNNIYVRGLATAATGPVGAGVIVNFPNVAVYLDEQSGQLPNRNLDVYAADLERIEILEGPQGTLFGAGAQAGVVRYITKKPKLDLTEGTVNAGYGSTAHGDSSSNLEATLNLPILPDRWAVRAVAYSDHRGGYIDNIPGTFARSDSDPGMRPFGGRVPANSVVINNFDLTRRDSNPITYQGFRITSLYQFDENWNALVAQSYQSMEAEGVSAEMAANSIGEPQPDLSVQLYNPSYDHDRFENTALTVTGRVGALRLLYAGSYLVRNVEQVQDYTSYSRGLYASYYQCVYLPSGPQCFSPSQTWRDIERNTHQSHELRLSTPDDWRMRGVGGLFYEDYRIQEQSDGFMRTAPYFTPIAPPTGYDAPDGTFVFLPATSSNPNPRPPVDGFFDDITRRYRQKAAYASVDFDLGSALTLTLGTRYSSIDTSEVGSTVGSGGCNVLYFYAPNPCVNQFLNQGTFNLDSEGLARTFSGFRSRANLGWKVTPDHLLYFTWSQGLRAGSFNRTTDVGYYSVLSPGFWPWQAEARAHGGWQPSQAFAPDELTNNEVGWKTRWADQRIRWDGAIYQEDWSHVQIALASEGVVAYTLVTDGGYYRVRGLETSCAVRFARGLTVEANAAWNHSELMKVAPFVWADGTPIDFSTLVAPTGRPRTNPAGALGSSLAAAPPFAASIRARYEFPLRVYDAFAQIGIVHQSHSLATTDQLTLDLQDNSTAYDLPPFNTFDAAIGIGKDRWLVQIYGQNLTDARAQLYASYAPAYKAVTVTRPRTISVNLSYRVGGK